MKHTFILLETETKTVPNYSELKQMADLEILSFWDYIFVIFVIYKVRTKIG